MAINAVGFLEALEDIESSKQISKETVIEALKEALEKGYKKQISLDYKVSKRKITKKSRIDDEGNEKIIGAEDAIVRAEVDPYKGVIELYQIKNVVKEVEDDLLEISVEDANELDKNNKYKVGDEFKIYASIDELKKATALSIKSIMKQKFVEAEKNILYENFKDKIGTMITGRVENVDEKGASINIGKTSVFLLKKDMVGDERFANGDNIKIYVSNVDSGAKGAHIVVSRASEGFLKCLFQEEINEIFDGTITIKAVSRMAGERSKVAVYSSDINIDAAGACIGPNGSRIQKIVSQLGNGSSKEKIDIITYNENVPMYIMESLKPARIMGIKYDEVNKSAICVVKDDAYTLAIGKRGVNVKLAVRLTGYSIDIKTEEEAEIEGIEYIPYEEIEAQEIERRAKMVEEKQRNSYYANNNVNDVLPGVPSGYVAPDARVYEEEVDDEMKLALEEEVEKAETTFKKKKVTPTVTEEKVESVISPEVASPAVEEEKAEQVEEIKAETPVMEEAKTAPKKEEKPVETINVKTTTSLDALEKSLEEEKKQSNVKKAKKTFKKRNNKDEDEMDEDSPIIEKASEVAPRLSIYTEEELKAFEEEEAYEEEEEEEVDYDQYDDYYDSDDR